MAIADFYKSFTMAQRAVLDTRHDKVRMAIEINDTTPFRYCTGDNPVQIDGDWYDPHPMRFDKIQLTDPLRSRTTVTLADQDGLIRAAWYSSLFDCDATVHWLLRDQEGGAWVSVLSVEWFIQECEYDQYGNFKVRLSGAAGSKPRNGGRLGTFGEFPYAPEAGEPMQIGYGGDGGIVWRPGVGTPPTAPGGPQMAYDPRNTQTAMTNGETISDNSSTPPSSTPPLTPPSATPIDNPASSGNVSS